LQDLIREYTNNDFKDILISCLKDSGYIIISEEISKVDDYYSDKDRFTLEIEYQGIIFPVVWVFRLNRNDITESVHILISCDINEIIKNDPYKSKKVQHITLPIPLTIESDFAYFELICSFLKRALDILISKGKTNGWAVDFNGRVST